MYAVGTAGPGLTVAINIILCSNKHHFKTVPKLMGRAFPFCHHAQTHAHTSVPLVSPPWLPGWLLLWATLFYREEG